VKRIYAQHLQQQCGPHAPDDYARSQLLALAMERPELQVAWKYRDLTGAQRQAVEREFRQLEQKYRYAQTTPDSPEKAQALAEMERRGQELAFVYGAQKMLNDARNEIRTRAGKLRPPIDEEATADRNAVAQAVRESGSGRAVPPEPPIQWGRLTENEFRNLTREKFGF